VQTHRLRRPGSGDRGLRRLAAHGCRWSAWPRFPSARGRLGAAWV